MNRLVYRDYTFYDFDIFSGNCFLTNSMVSETLESDTLTFNVTDESNVLLEFVTSEEYEFITVDNEIFETKLHPTEIDLKHYTYGEPIYYYQDNNLISKFFVKSILQRAKNKYEIEALSRVGLLIKIQHMGGIYNGVLTGDIIYEILGDTGYTIDEEVANIPVYGYLPIASKRDNLKQVLFVAGASVLKKSNGDLHITFNQPYNASIITDDRLYLGGSRNYNAPATDIIVTEHSFYETSSVEETVLYDNTNDIQADYQLIRFNNPVHSLRATDATGVSGGIIIHESNANYAIISGTGILYGKEYVHAQRTLRKHIDIPNAEEKEVTVTDATLVSALNSQNVLNRIANYYSNADTVSYGLVVGEERPGSLILFTDPFGVEREGYIKDMEISVSSKLKANITITTNWKPLYLGNNFTNYKIISMEDVVDGVWTVPDDMIGKSALAVLFGGAYGGNGGYDGKTGGTSSFSRNAFYIKEWTSYMSGFIYAAGGAGGTGGEGGKCGNYLTFSIDELLNQYEVTIGVGGAGGAANGGIGEQGTPTIFDGKSTDNGIQFVGNYVNLISGEVYAQNGKSGVNGGAGGAAGGKGNYTPLSGGAGIKMDYTTNGRGYIGDNGGDVLEAKGGLGADTVESDDYAGPDDRGWYEVQIAGSGGGGAAYLSQGQDAVIGVTSNGTLTTASIPGNGADAEPPIKATMGKGGDGGNGGGGAGARGGAVRTRFTQYGDNYTDTTSNYPTPATPGKGTAGAQGSDGFILIYY